MSDHQPVPPGNRRAENVLPHLITKGIILVVLIVVVIGGVIYWKQANHAPAPNPGAVAPAAIPVDVIVVERRNVPWKLRYLGQTEPSQRVEIRSRVRGYLENRSFVEGQPVKKGDALFQIDPRPFQAELAQSQASLASAHARLDLATTQLARYEELETSGAATTNELQEWQKEKRVAEAEVKLNEARVEQSKLDLAFTSILAPIDGVMGESLKDVGSYIDDGSNGLLAVLRTIDPMYIRYSISEQDMLRWQRLNESGQISVPKVSALDLEITLSDGRVYPHLGRINFVDVQVDPSTGTAVIRGVVDNPDRTLLPGQFVHASLKGVDRLNVLSVPQTAIVQTPAGASVYVVEADNKAVQRHVTLGDWTGNGWLVEDGLKDGEHVIINHLQSLRVDTVVQPTVVVDPTIATPATQPAATQPADESHPSATIRDLLDGR
jgi:membrane fusion protein (multidrug efflux system)